MKPAEDGSGDLILRLYESMKSAADADIALDALRGHRAFLCDLCENPQEELPVTEGSVRIPFQPFQIRTLRISLH